MKLVIEIPEEQKKMVDAIMDLPPQVENDLVSAIRHGKPLDSVLDKIWAEIEPKCDRINSLASVLPYTAHREIQELLCEIMNLCKAESEGKNADSN